MNTHSWPDANSLAQVTSPGLLLNLDLVDANLNKMIAQVGGQVKRLRPHVKTHKMSRVVELQRAAGIEKFKAATLTEAAMVAASGGKDVLIAYPLVGPNLQLFAQLVERYPATNFSCIVDHPDALALIEKNFATRDEGSLGCWIDVDCGMHRTGIALGDDLNQLRDAINRSEIVTYRGLHVYDGHLHQTDLDDRRYQADQIKTAVEAEIAQHDTPDVVVGGSPTFGFWANESVWQCSPGTPIFWDNGYGSCYPDLDYDIALALVTRVISKPGEDCVCVDMGYKSIASETPLDRRVILPSLKDACFVGQSEEHMVIKTSQAGSLKLGDALIAFPKHVCPTIALHHSVEVIRGGEILGERWVVDARDRPFQSNNNNSANG